MQSFMAIRPIAVEIAVTVFDVVAIHAATVAKMVQQVCQILLDTESRSVKTNVFMVII